MQDFYVYMRKCGDGSYYIGHTDDLDKRLQEHRAKTYSNYTSTRLPIFLVYFQTFGTRDEAFAAERQIKGWSRKKKEALIKENWDEIPKLSKKSFK